jgi:hypothetical protein
LEPFGSELVCSANINAQQRILDQEQEVKDVFRFVTNEKEGKKEILP